MKRLSHQFSKVVTQAVLLFAASITADAGLVKLADSGDLEPNSTNEFFLISQSPTLNDHGQVTFYTDLRYNGFFQGYGIFLADGDTVTTVARAGQPAPDLNGNFSSFYDPTGLNSTGQVFQANLTGTLGGSADNAGIYRLNGGTLSQLAREGQPAPDNGGTFINLQGKPIRINRSAQTAFACTTSSNSYAIYRSTGSTLTRLAYYNEPSPDGNGNFAGLFDPTLNNNGQAAFYASVFSPTNGSVFGVFLADGSSLKVLARGQQTSPDGNGYFLIFLSTTPALNDNGQFAFETQLAGTSGGAADNQGLYRTDGNTTTQLVRKGQLVPNGNGRFLDFGGQGHVAINNSGQVAFFADLTGTTGGSVDNAGIFMADGNTVTQLARKGQAAPDGNGVFLTFGYPALNNKGAVAFKATLTGTSGGSTDNQGVYSVNTDLSIQQIIRAGQVIDGESVSSPNLLDGPNYGGVSGLNDEGQMAVWSYLNGNAAVYLWSRPEIMAVGKLANDASVTWKSFGGTTDIVQAASAPTDTFTNIGTVIVRPNRLVSTNFSESGGAIHTARYYRIWEAK